MAASQSPLPSADILVVVDDNPVQRAVLRTHLSNLGYQVATYSNPGHALQDIPSNLIPQLIFTDLHMPDVDGWKFCQLLRSHENQQLREVPIVVCSATFAGADTEEISASMGANAFLSLPVGPERLREVVSNLLEKQAVDVRITTLLVEDSVSQAMALKGVLDKLGFSVWVAETVEQGLALYERLKPRVVILDYHLPGGNAERVLDRVKQPTTSSVAVVVTADTNPRLALEIMSRGADDFIRKPADPEYLAKVCRRALRRRSMLRVEEMLEQRTRQLEASEQRFRMHFENISDVICVLDPGLKILDISPSIQEILGYEPEELVGKTLREAGILTTDSLLQAMTEASGLFNSQQVSRRTLEFAAKDGSCVHAEIRAELVDNFDGGQALIAVCRDVTGRAQLQLELERQREQYRTIFDAVPAAIWYVDHEMKIVRLNREAARLMGEDDVRKARHRPFSPLFHGAEETLERDIRESLAAQKVRLNVVKVIAEDGRHQWFQIATTPYRDAGGRTAGTVVFALDLTNFHQTKDSLRKLAAGVEATAEAVLLTDSAGVVTYANAAFESITGNPKNWVEGRNLLEFRKFVFAEEVPWNVFEQGGAWRGQLRFNHPQRGVIRVEASITPVADPLDQSDRFHVVVLRDVTEHQRLEANLRQIANLEAVGQVASGLAHNFRNLLTGIQANLSLALEESDRTVVLEYVREAKRWLYDASELAKKLSTFSRKSALKKEAVDLEETLAYILDFARNSIGRRVDIYLRPMTGVLPVLVDRKEFQGVMLNLLLNAGDAASDVLRAAAGTAEPPHLEIAVSARNREVTRQEVAEMPWVHPGLFVEIVVTDTCGGIQHEHQHHIFEPLFTTKPQGKGTGLGLATSLSVIRDHGGWMYFKTKVGQGTQFYVTIPAAGSIQLPFADERPSSTEIPRGRETVLVVDDEVSIRETLTRYLGALGYLIITAKDGREGLDVFARNQDHVDLIVLDWSMPNVTGREFLERLRAMDRQVRVVVTSGFGLEEKGSELTEHGVVGTLVKPFELDDVARLVRRVLDA
jgi:PAS domain S-box-containing protein